MAGWLGGGGGGARIDKARLISRPWEKLELESASKALNGFTCHGLFDVLRGSSEYKRKIQCSSTVAGIQDASEATPLWQGLHQHVKQLVVVYHSLLIHVYRAKGFMPLAPSICAWNSSAMSRIMEEKGITSCSTLYQPCNSTLDVGSVRSLCVLRARGV